MKFYTDQSVVFNYIHLFFADPKSMFVCSPLRRQVHGQTIIMYMYLKINCAIVSNKFLYAYIIIVYTPHVQSHAYTLFNLLCIDIHISEFSLLLLQGGDHSTICILIVNVHLKHCVKCSLLTEKTCKPMEGKKHRTI